MGRSKPCSDSRSAPPEQQCGNAQARLRRSLHFSLFTLCASVPGVMHLETLLRTLKPVARQPAPRPPSPSPHLRNLRRIRSPRYLVLSRAADVPQTQLQARPPPSPTPIAEYLRSRIQRISSPRRPRHQSQRRRHVPVCHCESAFGRSHRGRISSPPLHRTDSHCRDGPSPRSLSLRN